MSDKIPVIPGAPKLPSAPATTAKEQLDALNRVEAKTIPGAPVRTPKETMLDARDLEVKEPDKHFRWVNITDPNKVQTRLLEGYERVPESEGGRSLSDVALFKQPREKFDERKAREAKLTREREHAHVHEVEQAVEGVARFLRDRYGIRVDPNRMIVKE